MDKTNLLKKLFAFPIMKKLSIALSGTMLGQLIALASSPILSRLLGPSVFGAYSVFISLSVILYVITTLTLDQAVSVADSMQESVQLIQMILINSFVSILILTPVFYLFREPLCKTLGLTNDYYLVLLIPIYAALYALYMACYFFYLRWGKIRQNANLKIIMPVCVVFFNVVIGFLYKGDASLVLSQVLAYIVILLLQIKPMLRCMNEQNNKGQSNKTSWRELLLKYRNYPIKFMPSTLINNICIQLPSVWINSMFGTTVGGYYALVNKSLSMPVAALSSAFGDVYRNESMLRKEAGANTTEVFKKFFKILFAICFPAFLLLFFLSPTLFSWFFGEAWREAGVMASYMIPMYFIKTIVLPFVFTLVLYNKHSQNLYLQIALLAVSLLSFVVGGQISETWQTSVLLYTIGFVLVYVVYLVYSYYLSKRPYPKAC